MANERDTESLYDAYLDACLEGVLEDPVEFCARHGRADGGLPERLRALLDLLEEPDGAGVERSPACRSAFRAGEGLPRERLGPYRILRRLGRGGMGTVFLAEDETLGRPVALKVVRRGLADSPRADERFRREALAVGRLAHPNVVRVYGLGEEDGIRYMAMELVRGRSLAERYHSAEPLDVETLLRWIRDLALALDHAHRQGVVHRDVKPDNVRITPEGRPVLLDFGIAKDERWRGQTITRAYAGSPLYSAPEQLRGSTPPDARTDVWSLGATLYEGLTGRVPFRGKTVEETFQLALTAPPRSPRRRNPRIPRDLEVVVLTALSKRPGDRYSSAAEMATDLDAVLEGRPIRARPPGLLRRARFFLHRHPRKSVALLVFLAVVVAGGAWLEIRRATRAREAIETARGRLERYRRRRAESEEVEREVTDLTEFMHARYMSEEEEELLRSREREVERLRLEREAAYHEVLELLRRAERLGATAAEVGEVRAELFLEKWREAKTARDGTAADYYERQVERHDPTGRLLREIRRSHRVALRSKPAGAAVHVFRCVEQRELFPRGEERLVPVPARGGKPPVRPGTWALRVVRGAGSLRPLDLIVSIEGRPVRGTVFGLTPDGGIVPVLSAEGRPVEELHGLEASDAEWVETGAGRIRRSELRILNPRGAAERGGLRARVLTGDGERSIVLPAGLEVRTTATPLVRTPESRVGTTPVSGLELETGSYVFLFLKPGFLPQPLSVRVREAGSWSVELAPAGRAPPGFIRVPHLGGFWIMEREVLASEYLEFLNSPRVRPKAGGDALVPRGESGVYWRRDSEDRFALPDDWRPDWPALGVSCRDAEAYARWRSRRDGLAYALPTKQQWLAAAHGTAARHYVFGNRFRPKWAKSCYARPKARPEPVMRFPVDESPYGVYDMAGSAREWLAGFYDEERGLRRIAGGSWATADPEAFKLYGLGAAPRHADGSFGFRLVLRPEEGR